MWDDVEHTIFVCPYFGAATGDLTRLLKRDPEPEDIGSVLCGERARRVTSDALKAIIIADDKNKRRALITMVEKILSVKESDERVWEAAQRARLADRRRTDAGQKQQQRMAGASFDRNKDQNNDLPPSYRMVMATMTTMVTADDND